MILNQFVLGGSNGDYPINDFSLELNYDRSSKLTVKIDPSFINEIKNETYLMFYYLDNLIFEGIPYFAQKTDDSIDLYIYDKNAALWITGGFALVGSSGIIEFRNEYVFDIVASVLKGSQFTVLQSSVPNKKITITGNWATKTDFLYGVAKLCMDEYGNTCTMWVDSSNVVNIGPRNSNITVDLSTITSGSGKEDINLINFGGVIIQGGVDDAGDKVLELSNAESTYLDYDLNDKSFTSYNQIYTPQMNKSLSYVTFDRSGACDSKIRFGFGKNPSTSYSYKGAVDAQVRYGSGYSNKVTLKDKIGSFNFEECDICFTAKLNDISTGIGDWAPPAGYGPPYTFINNLSVGLMDENGAIKVSITIERYGEIFYANNTYRTMNNSGYMRFYLNFEEYLNNESIGMQNPSTYQILYGANSGYTYLFWFSRRYGVSGNTWSLKVIKTNFTTVWQYLTGTNTALPDLFNGTIPYDTLSRPSTGLNTGGYPFIKSEIQTDLHANITNIGWKVGQITNGIYNVPMFLGTPQKSIQHKPYLFFSDANVKFKSQAKSLAKNLYNDYTKVITADMEIDPMAFYYPDNKISIGCIANFSSPAPVIGKYRIKGIVATPQSVTVSLQNRSLNTNDIIDRIQKQMKDNLQ